MTSKIIVFLFAYGLLIVIQYFMMKVEAIEMITGTFINLETQDVTLARSFFIQLGLAINEDYSDPDGICVVVNDYTYLMIMNKAKFRGFTKSETPNSFHQTEVILSFQCDSKQAVDDCLTNVKAAKGSEVGQPGDSDFMYYRAFRDLDGHRFEVFYIKPTN